MSFNCPHAWEEYKKLDLAYDALRREYLALRGEQVDFTNVPKAWLVKVRGLRGRCLDLVQGKENLFQVLDILNLKEQYYTQYETLKKLNLLQLLSESKKWGIVGIDGKEYPIPEFRDIQSAIFKNYEKYEKKVKQGFTRLQLTPFALPLRELILALEKSILKHHKEGKLLAPKVNPTDPDERLELDENEPVWNWDGWWDRVNNFYKSADELGETKYYSKEFSRDNHGGKTKQEVLDEERVKNNNSFAGWKVLLLEDDLILKDEGKGKTIVGRKQLEANERPKDYLKKIQSGEQYSGEQGLTNEDWLMLFMNNLEENNRVLDDWQGQGKASYLLASWSPVSGYLGVGRWARNAEQAFLNRSNPDHRSNYACRSAVGLSSD